MLYVVKLSHCAFGDGAVLLFNFSKTKETESLHILAGLFDILFGKNAFSTIIPIFVGLFDFNLV